MLPQDFVIVGPTSSRKTALANLIAGHTGMPVFNCDSVQVYEELTVLSNKPRIEKFVRHESDMAAIVEARNFIDITSYANFTFRVIRRKSGNTILNKDFSYIDFFGWLVDRGYASNFMDSSSRHIVNFLLDCRKPLGSYSVSEFVRDVRRISEENFFSAKIVAGGTVYYAYHYVLGTDMSEEGKDLVDMTQFKDEFEAMDVYELLEFIEEHDPNALELIDIDNKARMVKVAAHIKATGERFSDQYFKEHSILDDLLLVMITPNDRTEFYRHLDRVVEMRLNEGGLDEARQFIGKYGEEGKAWLSSLSYEYSYACKMLDVEDEAARLQLLAELKFKEHQYTKRQLVFMRKLEKAFGAKQEVEIDHSVLTE